jgi:transcriptional regulator with XRE-family HTH domain
MTISRKMSMLLTTIEQEPIPRTTIAFFQRTNQNRYHSLILRLFKQSGLTQLTLAKRLGKEPAQINRLLSAAGNWTINTIAALMLAMGVDLDDPSATPIAELVRPVASTTTQSGPDSRNNVVSMAPYFLRKQAAQPASSPLQADEAGK